MSIRKDRFGGDTINSNEDSTSSAERESWEVFTDENFLFLFIGLNITKVLQIS